MIKGGHLRHPSVTLEQSFKKFSIGLLLRANLGFKIRPIFKLEDFEVCCTNTGILGAKAG